MKIKLTKVRSQVRKRLLFTIMKTYVFLLCTVVFGITTENSFSQEKVIISSHQLVTIDQVFKIIKQQTNYRFIYPKNLFKDTPRIQLKKGNIEIGKLLKQSLSSNNLNYKLTKNNTIIIEKMAVIDIENYQQKEIKGTVKDKNGESLPGTNIIEKGTTNGVITDFDGKFTLKVTNENAVLVVSYLGFVTQEVAVGQQTELSITLIEDTSSLEEVVLVGYGYQKKKTIVGAITSVKPSDLKIPSSNLTTALAGRVSGIVSYQLSGEPGADNTEFFIRGVASFNGQNGPLILIDGIELTVNDLARLQPDDIESFSILKDPTTTAIYGARGANGIILVTTKQGTKGPPRIRLRVENSFSSPVSKLDIADPYTYISLQNKAARYRGGLAPYTEAQVLGVKEGLNKNVFPTVNWQDELFKDYATTQRINLNVSGGGEIVKYYVAASLNNDNGTLKVDPLNDFNSNVVFKNYSFRSNINIALSKSTEMILRLNSTYDDLIGPLKGGNDIYKSALKTSPVRFPAKFDRTPANKDVPFILFGNSSAGRGASGTIDIGNSENPVWFNPYAELQRGYFTRIRQLNLMQIEFKQNLDFITEGLRARFLGNINSTSQFENRRAYSPFFYELEYVNPINADEYREKLIGEGGSEALNLEPSRRINNSVQYVEIATDYARTFAEKHAVTGLLVAIARDYSDGQATNLQLSLPSRNVGISGRFNYAYNGKYFVEFNFGYNGSERFAKNNRFGFFPSYGIGWLISEEPFLESSSVISHLKLRASYGLVGNDRIGNRREDRFFYLSQVNLDNNGRGHTFGEEFDNRISGVSISRYANPNVTWELAEKLNIGIETNFFQDALKLTVDVFGETRSNILQLRSDIPSTLGLSADLQTNVGEVKAWGLDSSMDFNFSLSDNLWLTGRATFTYADNKYTVFEEPNYANINAPWRSYVGDNVRQSRGFIAERLFVDDDEAINSPKQLNLTPGKDYGAGDIKYKDLNKDGIISDLDRAAIGNPTVPKITYGFGFSVGYKKFDISVFFQGLAQTSFMLNQDIVGPFLNVIGNDDAGGGNGSLGENALLQAIADSHWSEENNDIYARWPKLSTTRVRNNSQHNTYWLRNGAFLRLKQVEMGFNLLKSGNKLWGMNLFRIYATGTNLHVWSKFKMWDPELKREGFNYPLQRVLNFGIQVGF